MKRCATIQTSTTAGRSAALVMRSRPPRIPSRAGSAGRYAWRGYGEIAGCDALRNGSPRGDTMNIEPKDWIALGAALGGATIVAIGWFVTGWLNRRKDVAQKRLEYRLQALESFLPVWFIIQSNPAPFTDPDFQSKLESSRSKLHLYGKKDEIELLETFIHGLEAKDLPSANAALARLVPMVVERIRKELAIDD